MFCWFHNVEILHLLRMTCIKRHMHWLMSSKVFNFIHVFIYINVFLLKEIPMQKDDINLHSGVLSYKCVGVTYQVVWFIRRFITNMTGKHLMVHLSRTLRNSELSAYLNWKYLSTRARVDASMNWTHVFAWMTMYVAMRRDPKKQNRIKLEIDHRRHSNYNLQKYE